MGDVKKLEDVLRSYAQDRGIEGATNFEVTHGDGTTETIVSAEQAQRMVNPEDVSVRVHKGAGAGIRS